MRATLALALSAMAKNDDEIARFGVAFGIADVGATHEKVSSLVKTLNGIPPISAVEQVAALHKQLPNQQTAAAVVSIALARTVAIWDVTPGTPATAHNDKPEAKLRALLLPERCMLGGLGVAIRQADTSADAHAAARQQAAAEASVRSAVHIGYRKGTAESPAQLYALLSTAGELFTTPTPPSIVAAAAVSAAAAAATASGGAAAQPGSAAAAAVPVPAAGTALPSADTYVVQQVAKYQLHVVRGDEGKPVRACVAAGTSLASLVRRGGGRGRGGADTCSEEAKSGYCTSDRAAACSCRSAVRSNPASRCTGADHGHGPVRDDAEGRHCTASCSSAAAGRCRLQLGAAPDGGGHAGCTAFCRCRLVQVSPRASAAIGMA